MTSELVDLFYDVHITAEQRAGDRALQQAAAVANTSYTYVQKTRGYGHKVVTVHFDVAFITEPAFMVGATLVDIEFAGFLPIPSALLLRWLRDARGGYIGAQVVLSVDMRAAAGFQPFGNLPAPGSWTPGATVAHHLTFLAPSRAKLDATASTSAQATDAIDVDTDV